MAWTVDEVRTYSYTGSAQTETLEPGTYKFECWGAQGGGSYGGKGGYCAGEYPVSTTKTLNIYVGGQPTRTAAGWNGGGSASGSFGQTGGGGGSDIRVDGSDLSDRVIIGAGGGGRGSRDTRANGHGGGLTGTAADADGVIPGEGGTQSAGGAYGGSLGQGGVKSNAGGGGGGYYGGGAGQANYAGGGGGSSYYGTLANASTTSGQKTGGGEIKITCLSLDGGPAPTIQRKFAQFI